MGPTACGKTSLAVQLLKHGPFDIVNVDSAQIYRGMDIGTGKLDKEALRAAPHRLLDIRDPAEAYSAAEFRQDALAEISDIHERQRIPLLVGGTMLYFKTLRDGIAAMPPANTEIREEIAAVAAAKGWSEVHRLLAAVDPDSAGRIHPNDPQRLQRALEVYRITGQSMTKLHQRSKEKLPATGEASSRDASTSLKLHFIAIQPGDRGLLHKAIADRFQQMLVQGFVGEVESLRDREDLHSGLPSMKSVGYRQVWSHLEGELSFDEMVEKGIIATRQLAKRQLTWLRSWDNLKSLSDSSSESKEQVLKFVDSVSI